MALDPKLKFVDVDFVNNRFHLSDTTGMYSAANLGGYGIDSNDPNPSKLESDNEIDTFEIEVTRPGGTTIAKNINNISFISASDNDGYDIVDISVNNTIGFTNVKLPIANGEYTFKLIISKGSNELGSVSITKYIYNIEALRKKINSKFIEKVDFCKIDCECNKGLITLWSYYKALEAAIEQENNVQIAYLSEQIELLV